MFLDLEVVMMSRTKMRRRAVVGCLVGVCRLLPPSRLHCSTRPVRV